MPIEETWPMYRRLLENGCREMVLHWRFATSAAVNIHNCHPIRVGDLLMMHNGVLAHRHTATHSDTRCFARDVLEPDLEDFPDLIHDKKWVKRLEQSIGAGNKLVFWHPDDDKPVIVGEKRGLWHKGRWYSNTYAWSVPRELVEEDGQPTFWQRGRKIDWHGLYGNSNIAQIERKKA